MLIAQVTEISRNVAASTQYNGQTQKEVRLEDVAFVHSKPVRENLCMCISV
jgi:hypothetical protein